MSDLPKRIVQLVERERVLEARVSALENLIEGELKDVWEIFADCAQIFQAQVSFNTQITSIFSPAFPEIDFGASSGVLIDLEEALKNRKGGE